MINVYYFLDHPIQYQNPLLDKLSLSNKINLKVIYLSNFSLSSYFDKDFNKIIKFDGIEKMNYDYFFLFKNKKNSKIKFLIKLFTILKKNKPNYFWVHGYSDFYTISSIIIASILNIKVLVRGESNNLLKKNFIHKLYVKIFFFLIDPLVSTYLSIGKKNKEFYKKLTKKKIIEIPYVVGDFSKKKRITINNSTHLRARLKIDKDSFIIFFNAKIIERKNPEILIRSFLQVSQLYKKKMYLILAGDGILKHILIKKYKNFRNIKFVGFVNQELLSDYYSLADLFILPSKYDAWGLVVNEAMQFNKAIITSKNVGSSYNLVKNGVNGYVFNNTHHLKQSIINIANNNVIQKKFSLNSRIIIDRWNINVTVNKLNNFFLNED